MAAIGWKADTDVASSVTPSHGPGMPYSTAKQENWTSDWALLGQLEGAAALTAWFGFLPDFHDATIRSMNFAESSGALVLSAFRITSELDERGFYVLDRHARICLNFEGVSGVVLDCNPLTTVLEVGIRRLSSRDLPILNTSASAGDYELGFDAVFGGSGAIYAKSVSISVQPEPQ